MRVFKLLLCAFSFFLTSTLFSQTECDEYITPTITDDMFLGESSPCDPTNGAIFTYSQFQNSSDGINSLFGIPTDQVEHNLEGQYGQTSSDNVVDMLSASLGDLTPTDLVECFDVLCSPQLELTQEYFDMLINDLGNGSGITQSDIDDILTEVNDPNDPDAPSPPVTQSDFLNETGSSMSGLGGDLSETLSELGDLQTIIADALGITPDCADSPWEIISEGPEIFDPLNPFTGGGNAEKSAKNKIGKELQEKLEEKMGSVLQKAMTGEDVSNPNWFLGEVEGLGIASPSNLMPSPSATNTINSIQSGVNLYNGTGSFSLPLDNISSKDVSASIGISGSPGGLKVDDQEGLLGSNMDVSAGGKVTRVVKGLPDEFYGDINGLAYGYKRGIKPIVEFTGVDIGLAAEGPKWLKKIYCKIFQILLQDILNINVSGGCLIGPGMLDPLTGYLTQDPSTGGLAQDFLDNIGLGQVAQTINKEYGIGNTIGNASSNVAFEYKIFWKPLQGNYANLQLVLVIALSPTVKLAIAINFRAGLKIMDVPSEVEIIKKGIGYTHLTDASKMVGELGIAPLKIDNFRNLSPENKLKYLTKQYSTKKRSDDEFFTPSAFHFQNVMENIGGLFNTDDDNPFPIYNTTQLDLEPDEYYYDFGGYSGKFYFQPRITENEQDRIILVPFQDFKIKQIKEELPNGDSLLIAFTFTTPEGVVYTFDKKAYSKYDNYSLPTSFRYPEIGNDNTEFKKPEMGKVEYPIFDWWMGIMHTKEIRKDYMTNYYVEKGKKYISAWHVSNITSNITKERIDFTYINRTLKYNASKNWSQEFPNFQVQNNNFKTKADSDFGFEFKTTEWKKGFGNLTYSLSEVEVDELLVKTIENKRGKEAVFHYEQDNESIVGGSLCTKIEIFKNENFYKGWTFNYDTPTVSETEIECNIPSTNTTNGQGPVYAIADEYKLDFDLGEENQNGRFIFSFPMKFKILEDCIEFIFPIRLKFPIKDSDPNGYTYLNSVSEFGSLMQLKTLLGIKDYQEGARYKAEKVRNFLRNVYEIGTPEPIASIDYNGVLSELPKRYSINQDIWGYYNGISTSKSPFITHDYESIYGDNNGRNTDHFAFKHPNTTIQQFAEGRDWKSDLASATIGQIDLITLETGAYIKYDYNRQQMPINSGSLFSNEKGGLRIKSLARGSENGETKTSYYKYDNPTVINFPVYIAQHQMDEYFKDFEQRVKSGWKPLNEWQMNKGGYVGYGIVTELIQDEEITDFDPQANFTGDNGRVVHHFTNPSLGAEYAAIIPETEGIHLRQKRIFNFGLDNFTTTPHNESYHSPFAPLIVRDWRLGLENKTEVFNAAGEKLSNATSEFEFRTMNVEEGHAYLHYPKTQMFQFMYYGSEKDLNDDAALMNVVDAGTACSPNVIIQVIRFIMKNILTEHPYRYIDKDFYHADMYVVTEKVEVASSENENFYYHDNTISSNGVKTTNTYESQFEPLEERKLVSTFQEYSSGQNILTEYQYADSYDTDYSFLNGDILGEMNSLNYEVPIGQKTTLNSELSNGNLINGELASGSFTNYQKISNRYVAESVWGIREGNVVLTGRFDAYDTQGIKPPYLPSAYRLAKYGTGYELSDYEYFPTITMDWDEDLLLLSRSMSGFTTTNSYTDPDTEEEICQLRSSIDVNGLETKYDYDGRRRLFKVTSPGDLQIQTTDYVMNPLTIKTTTDFDDNVTPDQIQIQEMDGWGNPLATKRSPIDATLTSTVYDNLWRPIEQTQLGSGTTTIDYEFSPLGRVIQTTDAVGNISKVDYLGPEIPEGVLEHAPPNHEGYILFAGTKTIDPNDHESYNWSDAFGKGTIRVSGEGGVTISKYDNKERISKIFNPIGEKYEYEYNKYTGQLATKKIPGKAVEQFWYDKSMRMVAKTDAANNIILDYDNVYRLKDIHTGTSLPAASPIGSEPINEGDADALKDKLLLENTYVPQSTWMEQVREGILRDGGVNGTKTMVYGLDDYGRVENVTSTYDTDNEYIVNETFAPLTAAGLSEKVRKTVTAPGIETTLDYQFIFDKILRTTHTNLKLNDPSPDGIYKNIEQIVFNPQDQVSQKLIGGTTNANQYLQTVDYFYDGAGKLIRINDPLENGCVNEIEVCQLYWGSAAKGLDFNAAACGLVKGISLDGVLYEFPSPMEPNETAAMEAFINAKLNELNKQGTAEIHYQNFSGISSDFHISIMKTDVVSAEIVFQNTTDCTFALESKDCCIITAIGQDGDFPLSQTYSNNPDLFFEEITYNGMDISLIEIAGSCTAGFIRNHYKYDADHRLKQVQNQLFSPELIGDALSSSYSYDLAGNIMSLNRNGWVPEGTTPEFTEVDNLTYTYVESEDPILQPLGYHTSELEKVEDVIDVNAQNYNQYAQPHGFGKLDNISEYTHDALGRLFSDTGKGLGNVSYNLLNLPESIGINNGGIEHQYTFGGEKIKKTGAEGDRYYIGGIEYNDAGLEFINIPNGRILKEVQYQYNLTDHLGNVVVMFEDKSGDGVIQIEEQGGNEVLQRNHYYSFGMRVNAPGLINNGGAKNKYLYNGKELADDFGLDWHYYGFRVYDAAIGRFPSIDPIADNFAFVSGYNYAENSPIAHIDLWGLQKHAAPGAENEILLPKEKFSYQGGAKTPTFNQDNGEIKQYDNPTADYFAKFKSSELGAERLQYNIANSVYVVVQMPFYGRGDIVPTLDGHGVTKGSEEGIMTSLEGFMLIVPSPKLPISAAVGDDVVVMGFLSNRKRVPKNEAWSNLTNPTSKGHQKGGTLIREGDNYLKFGPEGFTKDPLPTTHTSTGNPSNYMENPLENMGRLLNDKIKDMPDPGGG